ncbi:MAG: hypothetical protein NZ957_03265 [Thaumarchaeota archaeon]|nr:hypothetical protein [Candidatus Calditenuaceae archaeon]MDW8042160.1 hypothetical protein [Nitrososphaerota archaeon]
MSASDQRIRVTIEHQNFQTSIEGDPEGVIRAVNAFFDKVLPTYSLAKRLAVNVSAEEVIKALEGYVVYDRSIGFVHKPTVHSFPAADQILALLATKWLENVLGLREQSAVPLKALSEALGLKRGTLTAALTELKRSGYVKSAERGDYEITKHGLQALVERLGERTRL